MIDMKPDRNNWIFRIKNSIIKKTEESFFPASLLILFLFLKWEDLYILPWRSEHVYINPFLLEVKGAFFFPWNYKPEYFMGHPPLQPLTLWLVFNIFSKSLFAGKAMCLSFSLLCLFNLYKATEALFGNKRLGYFSMIFTMFFPLFWNHSTLFLGDIPLMAFGFGLLYTFINKKYKTLLVYSVGTAMARESGLAFFVPLIFQAILSPSQRKSLIYMLPGLLLFFSHFFYFFP